MAEPWAQDLLASVGPYRAPEQRGGDEDVAGYIRQAASKRGIDPEVAIKVAQSEGGLVPNRTGSFKTGKSFWPFQLHYGGPGYEQYGNVAGMGNTFTAQTGYQPGDPAAWRAATDYALDAAQKNGWGAWYGARNVGVTGRQGIGTAPLTDRSAGPEPWAADLLAQSSARPPPQEALRRPPRPFPGSRGPPTSCGPPGRLREPQRLLRGGRRGARSGRWRGSGRGPSTTPSGPGRRGRRGPPCSCLPATWGPTCGGSTAPPWSPR